MYTPYDREKADVLVVSLLGLQRQYVTFDDRTLKQVVSHLKLPSFTGSLLGDKSLRVFWICLHHSSKVPTVLCLVWSLTGFLYTKQCWKIMSHSYRYSIVTLLLFITLEDYVYIIVLHINYVVQTIQILINCFVYLIYQLPRDYQNYPFWWYICLFPCDDFLLCVMFFKDMSLGT